MTTPYSKGPDNAAETAAKTMFEMRGTAPRLYRNTIVFLAADKTRLQDLDEAVRKFIAWDSILEEKNKLDLSPHQVKEAECRKRRLMVWSLPGFQKRINGCWFRRRQTRNRP